MRIISLFCGGFRVAGQLLMQSLSCAFILGKRCINVGSGWHFHGHVFVCGKEY